MQMMQSRPSITAVIHIDDEGNPTITFNSRGKSFSTDKMLTANIIQSCFTSQVFPHVDHAEYAR